MRRCCRHGGGPTLFLSCTAIFYDNHCCVRFFVALSRLLFSRVLVCLFCVCRLYRCVYFCLILVVLVVLTSGIYALVHACVRAFVRSCIRACVHSCVHAFVLPVAFLPVLPVFALSRVVFICLLFSCFFFWLVNRAVCNIFFVFVFCFLCFVLCADRRGGRVLLERQP